MTAPSAPARVAVVILNWNAWPDTIECLEAVMRLSYPDFEVLLCDNASTDGSRERFAQWARGELCVTPASSAMAGFTRPPVEKPIALRTATETPWIPGSVTFLENRENRGFAGGNNPCLRLALDRGADFAWVLNADTVPTPGALDALVARLEADPAAGLCGSLLCYYDDPGRIQEAGGCAYFPLAGVARRLAADMPRERPHDWRRIERRLGYISGASCLVSRAFLETVGPMTEDYFIYYEEIDWATRGRGRFGLALAENSIVYHKKGLVTGSKAVGKARSASSAFYLWRAKTWFTRRYHPFGLPGVLVTGLAAAGARLLSGDRAGARAIVKGLFARPVKDSNPRPAD